MCVCANLDEFEQRVGGASDVSNILDPPFQYCNVSVRVRPQGLH